MNSLEIGALVSALCLSALSVMLFLYWRAPRGYEDATGFHQIDEHADDRNLGI